MFVTVGNPFQIHCVSFFVGLKVPRATKAGLSHAKAKKLTLVESPVLRHNFGCIRWSLSFVHNLFESMCFNSIKGVFSSTTSACQSYLSKRGSQAGDSDVDTSCFIDG